MKLRFVLPALALVYLVIPGLWGGNNYLMSLLVAGFVIAVAGIAALFGLFQSGRAYLRAMELARRQSEFMAAVSHEMRTPLAAILSTVWSGADCWRRFHDRCAAWRSRIMAVMPSTASSPPRRSSPPLAA